MFYPACCGKVGGEKENKFRNSILRIMGKGK